MIRSRVELITDINSVIYCTSTFSMHLHEIKKHLILPVDIYVGI